MAYSTPQKCHDYRVLTIVIIDLLHYTLPAQLGGMHKFEAF
jgi:hypothetical protein